MSARDFTYTSPLMKRARENEQLTLATLKKYIPDAQAALKAQERLNEGNITQQEREELLRVIKQGEYAKERLVLISMPLIKNLAYKESKRRASWDSRISVEDIISEGLSGLMRGIKAYNVHGQHVSPTNYLGQWITTDMRRNTEVLDHDFSIPYEAIERQRKIRAVRSRLTAELGREPTDEEIIEGSKDETHNRNKKMGRSPAAKEAAKDKEPTRKRGITVKHIEEERAMQPRTGSFNAFTITDNGDERNLSEAARTVKVTTDPYPIARNEHINSVDAEAVRRSLSQVIESSMNLMSMGNIQRDVIRRKFGIPPYVEEDTIKNIVIFSGIPKHKVNRIIAAYSAAMTQQNGAFHKVMWKLGYDEAESIGLGWLYNKLGPYQEPMNNSFLKDLQEHLVPKNNQRTIIIGRTSSNLAEGSGLVTYSCNDNHTTTVAYLSVEEAPEYKPCMYDNCSRTSHIVTF